MSLPILRESADVVVLFDPSTGEQVVPAEATTDTLAAIRDKISEYDEAAKMAKGVINDVLLARMDAEAKWTAHVGPFKLTAPSPAPTTDYDGEALFNALTELVAKGVITADARNEAVTVEVTYTPRKQKINQLRKLGGEVQAAIDALAVDTHKNRYVSVKRAA